MFVVELYDTVQLRPNHSSEAATLHVAKSVVPVGDCTVSSAVPEEEEGGRASRMLTIMPEKAVDGMASDSVKPSPGFRRGAAVGIAGGRARRGRMVGTGIFHPRPRGRHPLTR